MKYSKLYETQQTRQLTDVFGGYNHNLRINDGEFYNMENLTSDLYPAISPRKLRGYRKNPSGGVTLAEEILAKGDHFCHSWMGKLYIDDEPVMDLLDDIGNSERQFISMGAYIIVFPDRKYINTTDYTDSGDLDVTYTSPSEWAVRPCRLDGEVYVNWAVGEAEPESPVDGMVWVDTSTFPYTYKQYTVSTTMWVGLSTVYVRIEAAGIGDYFSEQDAIRFDNLPTDYKGMEDLDGKTSIIQKVFKAEAGSEDIDYVVVIGAIEEQFVVSGDTKKFTAKRSAPEMDFVIESGNRLWGCRYGANAQGEIVNEIYASKLGDPKNWFSYAGTAMDSYAASCGTDGKWTGAISYMGYPIFFKESVMHKVYGSYPSQYQIQTTACRGVQEGAGGSLAIVNERLYYKSRTGICMYDGSLPQDVSMQFGDVAYTGGDGNDWRYKGAKACAYRSKYVVSMKSEKDGRWNLFIYDTDKGLWHREDEYHVHSFAVIKDQVYMLGEDADHIGVYGMVTEMFGDGRPYTEAGFGDPAKVEWMAETGTLGTDMPDRKYVSRLMVRLSMDIGSMVSFYIQYDSVGEWEHMLSMTGTTMKTFSLPLRPKRCDHFRIRIEGKGNAVIYSITKNIEQGSSV